ncbi:vWA domain-containing protein [Haloechinothrix salitolerans]|uniref:VWA domain-containing protein n=1 Tax=Haloechinothrix salitolerans TaxID=926830 RepID=A0ABW2C2D2_9PSEU
MSDADRTALLDHHIAFLDALREAGLPVSLAEGLDAARAMTMVEPLEREALRAAYAATVVKRHGHRPLFDELFDLWFPRAIGAGRSDARRARPEPRVEVTGGRAAPDGASEMRAELAELLFDGDDAGMRQLASRAVARFGEVGGGSGEGAGGQGGAASGRSGGTGGTRGTRAGASTGARSWSPNAVLDALTPKTLLAGLLRSDAERDEFAQSLARRTYRERIARFERLVNAEARRRIAEDRGADATAKSVVRPPLDQIDLIGASQTELAALRREIYPLARRLATKKSMKRRRGGRGPLDFRRTIRASLATGGVPVNTRHRPRKPHKPELVVLCDVSSSVASFARFGLLLVYALSEQFSAVRSFAFVDTVEEVTRHFTDADDVTDAISRMEQGLSMRLMGGGTNYGRVFTRFDARYVDAITPKTTLLVLGDARANYVDPAVTTFAGLVGRAKHAYWLNPEPRGNWGTGDSAALTYADVIDMVECRSLAQLADFVRDLE